MSKLNLTKFQERDFKYYFSLLSNDRVMAQITERSIPMEEAFLSFTKLLYRNGKHPVCGSYKIQLDSTREFVGLGHLTLQDGKKGEAEIGYMLLPDYWGCGHGSHIAKELIIMAEEKTNLKKLTATIDPENYASRRILEKHEFISDRLCEIDGLPGEILCRYL